jgi:hypothetical protein
VSGEPPRVHTHRLHVILIRCNVRGSKANRMSDGVPPPDRRHHPTNQSAVDGKTKDHDDVLQRHRDLARRKVERVGLQMPLIHEHRKRGGVHQRHTTGHEPSKGQELRLTYERYRSPHVRGLCVRILSGFKRCRTQ